MEMLKTCTVAALSAFLIAPPGAFASSHREAPITALDHAADITDVYAFVSYDHPDRVTFIMNVDPFLNPSNGPNYFPFDQDVLYSINIDNSESAMPNIQIQFRFKTVIRDSALFTAYAGDGTGVNAPANSPSPVAPGTQIVPPAITALNGPGSEGLSVQQSYTITVLSNGTPIETYSTDVNGNNFFAVPTNVGPRTMPNYDALAAQGVYTIGDPDTTGARVFAGTVADPFFIDLGAAFDTFNFRANASSGTPGVLTHYQDLSNNVNIAPNSVSGFNVNTIAIEVPIALITSDQKMHASTDPKAMIGYWATTSRPEFTIRRAPYPNLSDGGFFQVQRMGNPLVNELLIGTGSKDYWSMSEPVNDSQFASFDLDPLLARIFNAVYGINIPPPPRTDLLPLVTYAAPIAPAGTPAGPIADLLRLNTGVPPTAEASRSRLGLIGGDAAGFPNGRRLTDDVVDIAARVVGGGVLNPKYNVVPNNRIGDGVNAPDVVTQETFPYVHYAYSGRNSRHIDAGETGCGPQPTSPGGTPPTDQGGHSLCPVN